MDHDENFIVIRDKFPKGTIHWLVLPRKEMIEEIEMLTADHVGMLELMSLKVKQLEALARKELEDDSIELWSGFHSWPSMKLLHLHLISSDLQGARLTSTSHWISFTTPFFIRLPIMIERLKETGQHGIDLATEKKRKNGKPTCPLCAAQFPSSEKGVIEAKEHYKACRATRAIAAATAAKV